MGQNDLEKLMRDYNKFLKERKQMGWRSLIWLSREAAAKSVVGSLGTALGTSMAGRSMR